MEETRAKEQMLKNNKKSPEKAKKQKYASKH